MDDHINLHVLSYDKIGIRELVFDLTMPSGSENDHILLPTYAHV